MLDFLLVTGATLTLVFVITNIRKSRIKISDSIFWFVLAFFLLVMALFPQLTIGLAGTLGVESPANLVFLVIVAILLIKEFTTSLKLARLENKFVNLVQEIALKEKKHASDGGDLGDHCPN